LQNKVPIYNPKIHPNNSSRLHPNMPEIHNSSIIFFDENDNERGKNDDTRGKKY